MTHEHPRGAPHEWYLEHLATDHYAYVDPTFSRATVMAIHRRSHEDDAARIEAHKIAPFNDRRPRQVAVIERQRPLREPAQIDEEFSQTS